ncbi:MAG TPA: hypothetical protein VFI90_11100 [Rubrobacter sp.]|nr:hypothetical protein [Rubrobacter sp.]
MCYSYRDRQVDEEIRRTMREREDRRRREQEKRERAADKDRKLVRA